MNNEFVSYEIALKLKELGFNEPCFTYYYEFNSNLRTHLVVDVNNAFTYSGNTNFGYTLAPLYQQVFRWFREKQNLYGVYTMGDDWNNFYFHIWRNDTMTKTFVTSSNWVYETYEEAELACLIEMIKIIEKPKEMSKQTAVDFLVKKFKEYVQFFDIDENHEILLLKAIKQAKEMEKEQIKEAYMSALPFNLDYSDYDKYSNKYYNETYKKNQ